MNEDYEEKSFSEEYDSGMVAMVYICAVLFFALIGIVIYFLISAGGAV